MPLSKHLGEISIVGKISHFNFNDSNKSYKIFWLQMDDGEGVYCKGNMIKRKVLQEGTNVRLFGIWRIDPKFPQYGKQFFFSRYEIIRSDEPKEMPLETIFTNIGNKVITYKVHDPQQSPIALHVRRQLHDRIAKSSPNKKDFYFLTAFLDRNVPDDYCQWFRKRHPRFKDELISCWKEDEKYGLILQAIDDIKSFIGDEKFLVELRSKNQYMNSLMEDLPSNFRSSLSTHDKDIINEFFVCLKIIDEKYKRRNNMNVIMLLSNLKEETTLREYLLSLYGVGPKLANWTITNITGHWFVIDTNIKKVIKRDLRNFIEDDIEVSAKNADKIFECLFGKYDEKTEKFGKFSTGQFVKSFPDFAEEYYQHLPFIVTQYLWFHGRN